MEKSRDELLDGMTDLSLAEPFPDEVFYKIFEIEDHVERTQFVEALKNKARELGRALGDSPELSQLCREAYQEYRRGGISSAAYNAIYTVCLEYAQPR